MIAANYKGVMDMLYHAFDGTVEVDGGRMDYVRFGRGGRTLVLIPGLSLRGVKGSGLVLAYMYRIFAKDYTVYVLDKRADIAGTYPLRRMAGDAARAMEKLGIGRADIFGVSQGGMIAQYLAIDYPQLARKLVLGVTASRENPVMREAVQNWIAFAEGDAFEALVADMLEMMYSEAYVKRYRWLLPVLAKKGKPKDVRRFIALAWSCLGCDCYGELDKIKCPVFVIGGKLDKVVTGAASEEIAQKLGCQIHMYDTLGHAAYEEAKDFNKRIYDFLFP